jgi:CubicO group peptidase (beta-lactamase class C family)
MLLAHPHLRRAAVPALLAVASACAAPARGPAPRSADTFAARLDSVVPGLLRDNGVPGVAVGVVQGGRVAFTRGYGLADRAANRPMTPHTLLNFASISKPVTAWGVLRLVDRGAISLHAPVGPALRRWQLPPSEFDADGVTVARLLSHTAGISVPSAPWFPADTALPSLEQVLRGEAGGRGPVAVAHRPGERWIYSGGGYTILQLMVEEASGGPFAEYMRTTLFQPLGMRRTSFAPAAVHGDGVATGYDEQGNPVPPWRMVGTAAGGLYSSVDDFARLLALYARHGRGILRPATFETMLTAVAPVELEGVDVGGARYALGHGVHRTAAGERVVYHSGGNPGYVAYFLVMPERGDGLVIASNLTAGDGALAVFRRLLQLWSEHSRADLPVLY